MVNRSRRLVRCRLLGGLLLLAPGVARGAPEIGEVTPRGLQTGATTTLVVTGADLGPTTKIILPIPIASQKVEAGATDQRVSIAVTLPKETPPGIYPLRLANDRGISAAALVGVDDLPERPMAEDAGLLPVALNGAIGGATVLRTQFQGKKGQRVVVEVEARRLGAAFEPVIELLDPRRVPVAWGGGSLPLAGDCRIDAILPADGAYSVELHDTVYNAGSPGFFRLKIGDFSYADLAYPLGGRAGAKMAVQLLGKVPSAAAPTVDLSTERRIAAATLPPGAGLTGPAPKIFVDELPEYVEQPREKFNIPSLATPVAINGRLGLTGEEDRYRLLLTPGDRLRVELFAHRAGSPLDGLLSIVNDAGQPLATNDDQPGALDPGFDFVVPAGVTSALLVVGDLHRRGGERFVYRATIAPLDRPDYSLTIFDARRQAPLAGSTLIRVRAQRKGYNGPIKLRLIPAPDGLQIAGDVIPAGATDTLLSLTGFGLEPTQTVLTIVGESMGIEPPIRRTALRPDSPAGTVQPWIRSDIGVAVTPPGPIGILWSPLESKLPSGWQIIAHARVSRARGVTGPIRLSLLTSQIAPRLPDGKEDVGKTIRVEGTPIIAADRTEGTATIIVPSNLAATPFDLALQAELLSDDQKQVRAVATSESRRFDLSAALGVGLSSANKLVARAGEGPTGSLAGSIERRFGFTGAVTLSLVGMPADSLTPEMTVPAEQTTFNFPIAFPFGQAAGALANVRLMARATLDPNRVLASNEVPLDITVVKGTTPALYRVFEDESSFVSLLTEGDAAAALEPNDRYSGAASLKIPRVQRYRTRLPTLGLKIAEKPGEGEYRYLRYAWKKKGGAFITLQIGANNGFGPLKGAAGPAFRYEAGPAENNYNGAAIRLGDKLPEEWTVVTRDLFADFGAFLLSGLAFTPGDGEYGLFDHVYLARSLDDFKGCPAPVAPAK